MRRRSAALPIVLGAIGTLRAAALLAQSGGRDLPRGFRSLAGVTLDRDSAATIVATLGRTIERRVGAGHDASTAWCYVAGGASSRALLELMSDASTMGTPGRELNVIRLRADAPSADRDGCAPLPASAPLATPAGLRLGLGASEVERLLGRPTRAGADSLVYEFEAREYLSPGTAAYDAWNTLEYRESCFDAGPPFANVGASVVVVLRDGRAVEIRLARYDQAVC